MVLSDLTASMHFLISSQMYQVFYAYQTSQTNKIPFNASPRAQLLLELIIKCSLQRKLRSSLDL